jgi:restriction endonuclease
LRDIRKGFPLLGGTLHVTRLSEPQSARRTVTAYDDPHRRGRTARAFRPWPGRLSRRRSAAGRMSRGRPIVRVVDEAECQRRPSHRGDLYGENEPLPVTVPDLADLVAEKPRGEVVVKLSWSTLDDDSFERLMFTLISTSDGYENPEWLMRTHAPDRGRDLSVMRVTVDRLAGTRRRRVIIQCRHWQTKSVGVADVIMVKEQMTLWGTPRVEVLTVATTGRFTADAVQWVETHNDSGGTPSIEMWPESHLELLLAARPDIVAEFELRHRLQQKIVGATKPTRGIIDARSAALNW